MRLLLAQINDMTETDKIEKFINGLKSNTQGWVRYEKPSYVEEAVEYAVSYERSFFKERIDQTKS